MNTLESAEREGATPMNTKRLEVTARGDREIRMTRVFDAPRALVFDCWTRPELIRRWLLGPPGWSLVVCEIDLRVGGAYRFAWRNEDGTDMGMGGKYLEIASPERLVTTELFDQDWTGGEAVQTFVLTEKDGRTTMTNTVLYASREARDGALKSGMEEGMAAGYDVLDQVLASLASGADAPAR